MDPPLRRLLSSQLRGLKAELTHHCKHHESILSLSCYLFTPLTSSVIFSLSSSFAHLFYVTLYLAPFYRRHIIFYGSQIVTIESWQYNLTQTNITVTFLDLFSLVSWSREGQLKIYFFRYSMENRQHRTQQRNKSDGERKLNTPVTCPPRDTSCLSITFDKTSTKGAEIWNFSRVFTCLWRYSQIPSGRKWIKCSNKSLWNVYT